MNRSKHVAIVGGGIAGMESAKCLSREGYRITLVEKEKTVGGHVAQWSHLFPDFSDPAPILTDLSSCMDTDNVKIITNTKITGIEKKTHFHLKAGDELSITADAVLITAGFHVFDATRKEEYGYGLFRNVITSVDLEQKFKKDKKITTASGNVPRRIAIIHCVGSRDAKSGNTYCSKVCCITGVKQAIEISKRLPETEVYCFYMDLRLYGSRFDELYLRAQKQHNIQFIRGRLSEAAEKPDHSLQIKAEDTLSGRPLRMNVNMIVLLVGMEPSDSIKDFAGDGLLEINENGFLQPENIHAARNRTGQPGIFIAGACICPMSVNDTLENARSAALEVSAYLKEIL